MALLNAHLRVRLPRTMKTMLNRVARRRLISTNDLVREVLRKHLEKLQFPRL